MVPGCYGTFISLVPPLLKSYALSLREVAWTEDSIEWKTLGSHDILSGQIFSSSLHRSSKLRNEQTFVGAVKMGMAK